MTGAGVRATAHTAGRVGLVAALVIALGVGADLHPAISNAQSHGCSPSQLSTVPTVLPGAGAPQADRSTVVYDDFDGPAGAPPDPDKWTVVEGTGWDGGIQNYIADGALLDGKGHLELRADKTLAGYTSGRVETRRKVSFGYGTLVARIKTPAGQGMWPSFWLIGADEDVNPWPGAGEIDILEQASNPRKRYSTLHGPIPGVEDFEQVQIAGEGPDLTADFHNYWVIHRKDAITVGMDDTVWGSFTPESLPAEAKWVYNKPFCLIMNLSVGGEWAGPPDRTTKFPAAMLVDWVTWKPAT